MEYVPGTTLSDYLRATPVLTLEMRKKLLLGLLMGVRDMQRQGVVHRDIKPENILVDSTFDRVKVVDFGLATFIYEPHYLFVRCGTPGYVAPEIIRLSSYEIDTVRLGIESDLFSVGAVYFRAVYGRHLFEGLTSIEATIKNQDCFIRFPNKTDMADGEL
jgi:serine/threonine protein kinase